MHCGKCLQVALRLQGLSYADAGTVFDVERQRVFSMCQQKNFNTQTLSKITKLLGYSIEEFAELEKDWKE